MSIPFEPLPLESLSEAARKAVSGPGPLKMMAARGLAPLKPVELTCVLYQLSLDADAPVKAAATKTAGELPEKILSGALADPALDARVIAFFATLVLGRAPILEAILLNRNTTDDTVLTLAGKVGEREVELIATNEERLLRAPAIIGALYMNPRARMSTVDRAVELAVRNKIVVPGVPSWDEVVAAVLGEQKATAAAGGTPAATQDAAFAAAAAVGIGDSTEAAIIAEVVSGEEVAKEEVEKAEGALQMGKLSIPAKIRLATLGNAFARALLIRDSNKMVAMATIRSPGVTDNEAVKYSANRALSDEVIREISNTKEWTKLYQIKLNLVNNPKCPLATSMRFLPFLHDKDLRNLARSKGIPTALSTQAKKLLAQKSGG